MSCFYFSNNDNKVLHLKQNLHAKFGNQVNCIEPTNAYVCENNNRGILPQLPMIRLVGSSCLYSDKKEHILMNMFSIFRHKFKSTI